MRTEISIEMPDIDPRETVKAAAAMTKAYLLNKNNTSEIFSNANELVENHGIQAVVALAHIAATAFEWSANLAQAVEAERSEEHTSELQSRGHLVCRLLLEKKKAILIIILL